MTSCGAMPWDCTESSSDYTGQIMRLKLFPRSVFVLASLLLLACVCVTADGQSAQRNASTMMTEASAEAAAGHKKILAVFSASWCGPCHMFEAFLKDPKIKPIMDRQFVTVTFDVGEKPGDKRYADTPGAVDLRGSLAGGEVGYPYIAMLDATGKPIVDSMRPDHGMKSNIGYPAVAVEIDWFMEMLRQAAPSMTPDEVKTIRRWLQDRAQS